MPHPSHNPCFNAFMIFRFHTKVLSVQPLLTHVTHARTVHSGYCACGLQWLSLQLTLFNSPILTTKLRHLRLVIKRFRRITAERNVQYRNVSTFVRPVTKISCWPSHWGVMKPYRGGGGEMRRLHLCPGVATLTWSDPINWTSLASTECLQRAVGFTALTNIMNARLERRGKKQSGQFKLSVHMGQHIREQNWTSHKKKRSNAGSWTVKV